MDVGSWSNFIPALSYVVHIDWVEDLVDTQSYMIMAHGGGIWWGLVGVTPTNKPPGNLKGKILGPPGAGGPPPLQAL